jgi:hypothetical protein
MATNTLDAANSDRTPTNPELIALELTDVQEALGHARNSRIRLDAR